jgi:tetratricopeptide (TPR) repeat protein
MTGYPRVVFISVPESLRGRIADREREDRGGVGDAAVGDNAVGVNFAINPDIPIPVEIPEGEEKLNIEELSWEMILSGMLRVIAAGDKDSPPEQIDYYRRFVLILRPDILGEFTEAAILKARNNDFDLALEILDALRGLFPGSPSTLLNRALVLEERAALFEKQGRREAAAAYQEAAGAYEEVLALLPPLSGAWFNAGFFYWGQKDFRRARECLSRYLEIADDEDKREQAESVIREIEENGLDDEDFRRAFDLIRQGREETALQSVRDFLERRPDVWNGWFMLGWALRRLGRYADGAAAFGRAIELGGGGCDTRNEYAICLMETGDYAAARRQLEAALREDPENTKIISNLGVLAMKTGDDDQAAAFFRAALEFDPHDPVAKEFFEKFEKNES